MGKHKNIFLAAVNFYRRYFLILLMFCISLLLLLYYISLRHENALTVDKWNINAFIDEEFKILENHISNVNLNDFGEVKFVPALVGKRFSRHSLQFYLLNENDNIEYQFPEFHAGFRIFCDFYDAIFQDLNQDNKTDILIFTDVIIGNGPNAAVEIPTVTTYFYKDKGFVNLAIFDETIPLTSKELFDEPREKRIKNVLTYIENSQEEIQQLLNSGNYNKDEWDNENIEDYKIRDEKEHRF